MEPKLLLLGLLRRQEMHGYQLIEFIERDLSTCTDLKKQGAYYLLNRMAQDGWIEERHEQEGNRPPRKVFSLTAAGEAAFQRLLRDNLSGYQAPGSPQDAGLAFMDALPAGEALALLETRRAGIVAMLEAIRAAPAHPGGMGVLIERQTRLLETDLDWIDSLLRTL